MPSPDIFKVLLVLLPGFVTTGVVRALTISREEGEFDKVVRALSYSFINYVILAVVRSSSATSYLDPAATPLSRPIDIALLGLIALLMGCLVSAYKNNDWQRALRYLRLTYRSSRFDIWHDCLVVEGSKFHVVVTLEDGRRIMGWMLRYSDGMEKPVLFLKDATWLTESGDIPTANEGILLLEPMKIASVEFSRTEEPTEEEQTHD